MSGKYISKQRRIGGKVFQHVGSSGSYEKAQHMANTERKKGKLARVTLGSRDLTDIFDVWSRPKQ